MSDFSQRIEVAEQLAEVASRLYRTDSVRLECAGRPVLSRSAVQLVTDLEFSLVATGCTLQGLGELVQFLSGARLQPCIIDVADLMAGKGLDTPALASVMDSGKSGEAAGESRPVVLNGFGRIGRLLVRLMSLDGSEPLLQLKAILVRPGSDLQQRVGLLIQDSVHGRLAAEVEYLADSEAIRINGRDIPFVQISGPEQMESQVSGLVEDALLIDSTGAHRSVDTLQPWLCSGISQILVTAPCKEPVPNVVWGVNSAAADLQVPMLSAASCTTNAVAPIGLLLHEKYDLQHLHMETVHAYTNDQNLVDNAHSSARRSRAATENLIITATGAQSAVGRILPFLADRMTATAVRVPVADVSLLTCVFHLEAALSGEALHAMLLEASLAPQYRSVLGFSSDPAAASSDFTGDRHACVIDGPSIQCEGNRGVLHAWYDNEVGYCAQVLRLAGDMLPGRAPQLRHCAESVI